jgi:cytochrome c556
MELLMNRRVGILFGGALLALGLWSFAGYGVADDDDKKEIKEAQEAIIKLMESVDGKKGDVKAQIAAIQKKFAELKPIMYVYKPRAKGGIGMKDGASIETELAKIGSKNSKLRLTKEKIASLKDDLIKAGKLSRTVADITDVYAPKKDTAEWKKYTQDMRKGGEELIEAAKSGEAAKIKTAANNLSASCTDCHSKFRND